MSRIVSKYNAESCGLDFGIPFKNLLVNRMNETSYCFMGGHSLFIIEIRKRNKPFKYMFKEKQRLHFLKMKELNSRINYEKLLMSDNKCFIFGGVDSSSNELFDDIFVISHGEDGVNKQYDILVFRFR